MITFFPYILQMKRLNLTEYYTTEVIPDTIPEGLMPTHQRAAHGEISSEFIFPSSIIYNNHIQKRNQYK